MLLPQTCDQRGNCSDVDLVSLVFVQDMPDSPPIFINVAPLAEVEESNDVVSDKR